VIAERVTRAARRGASENFISVIIPELLALGTARYVGRWSPVGVPGVPGPREGLSTFDSRTARYVGCWSPGGVPDCCGRNQKVSENRIGSSLRGSPDQISGSRYS
jgi:hypothetical protein